MPFTLPLVVNETIVQGATWRRRYRWLPGGVPQDFTGWVATLQVRADYADKATGPATLTLTDAAGITLDAAGNIEWAATAVQTAALTRSTAHRYDLELAAPAGGDTFRFVMGEVDLSREVTR